jgi:hypothetical protein
MSLIRRPPEVRRRTTTADQEAPVRTGLRPTRPYPLHRTGYERYSPSFRFPIILGNSSVGQRA